MTEQEIPKNFSISGLLKRIVSYETHHNSTTGPSGRPLLDMRVFTRLEILTDNGEIIPVQFGSYVGNELVNQRITYTCESEVTTGDASTRSGVRMSVIEQRLFPQDNNLPEYLASNCVYQG